MAVDRRPGRSWSPWTCTFPARPSDEQAQLRKVSLAWALLFFNVLGSGTASVLHIPHSVERVMTQGALLAAFALALAVNPRARARPNVLMVLYSLLAVLSLMMSVRFVSLGTDYRAFRLAGFVVVLWLLTPWWGAGGSVLLRSQLNFIAIILVSAALGVLASPGQAFSGGRLSDVIWSLPPTQVAHFAMELAGVTLVLWICGLVRRRPAIAVIVPSVAIVLLTHTRTALIGGVVALVIACSSLFTASRRVRRIFVAGVLVVGVLSVPLSPFIVNYLARGESGSQLTSLTGRTSHWQLVLDEKRPETNKVLGSGMSNDWIQGQAIDSSWLDVYQNQGLVGDLIVGSTLLFMLLLALFRPRGPARAVALYLVVYCLLASFTEDGLGEASQYMMDMVLAASLLIPGRVALKLPRWLSPEQKANAELAVP